MREEFLALLMQLLRKGKVEEFNSLRNQNPDIPLDFSSADLNKVRKSQEQTSQKSIYQGPILLMQTLMEPIFMLQLCLKPTWMESTCTMPT